MFCGNCGAEVKEGDRFCPNCGAALQQQPDTAAMYHTDGPEKMEQNQRREEILEEYGSGYQGENQPENQPGYGEEGQTGYQPGYGGEGQPEYQPDYQTAYQGQDMQEFRPEYQEDPVRPVKKGHGLTIACAILCGVIVILAAGIVFGIYRLNELNKEAEKYPVPQISADAGQDADSEDPDRAEGEEKKEEEDKEEKEDKKETSDKSSDETEEDEEAGKKEKIEITATPVPTAVPTAAPTAAATPVPTQTPAGSDYIFADSNSRYLTYEEIAALSEQQMSYARNEIYARHGRKFNSQELQNYFNSKAWYTPIYEGADFDAMQDSVFNEFEKANVRLISQVEKDKGYD